MLTALNEAFLMEKQNDMYFTIWYGVWQRLDPDAPLRQRRPSARASRHPAGGRPQLRMSRSRARACSSAA